MICPYCHRANRDTAKVCGYCGKHLPQAVLPPIAPVTAPQATTARAFPLRIVAAGCGILLILALGGVIIGGWYLVNQNASLMMPTTIALRTITPTPLPSLTPTTTATRTRAATPMPSITPLPTVPVPTIAGPKRFDPVGANKSLVSVGDVDSGKQYPFFASPGRISGSILSAAWSPDGKKVLLSYNWHSDVYDYGHIVRIVDENGANPFDIVKTGPSREGTDAAFAYRDAIWSPDGKRVAVRYQYGSDFGIWLFNADGTGKQRLASSSIGDWPRFWSVDGRWVIGVSSSDNVLYAEEIDGTQRVPFAQIKGIKMYDERYYPWRVIQNPVCSVTGAWFYTGGAFWDCE